MSRRSPGCGGFIFGFRVCSSLVLHFPVRDRTDSRCQQYPGFARCTGRAGAADGRRIIVIANAIFSNKHLT
jgi:hypothetical protein